MKSIIFLILSILLMTDCERNSISYPDPDQFVLFQAEYVNSAWGFSHNGFIIDSSGSVRRFNLPENWHVADADGYISIADMNENIRQLGNVSLIIDKDLLLQYFSKLKGASEGILSKPVNTMFDFGEITYSGYLFEPDNERYRQVLIRKDGDWTTENKSDEAEEIYIWMKRLFYQDIK
jgi:hypothetical protein